MSIQSIPPGPPTTAGQLAARATLNDQILASALAELEDRASDLESRSGTSGYLVRNVNGAVAGPDGRVDIGLPDLAQIEAMEQVLQAFIDGIDPSDLTTAYNVADPDSQTRAALDAYYAELRDFPVRLRPGPANAENNRAAIQAACDQAEAEGGGRVVLPRGRYYARGIQQGSRVHIDGSAGTTLIHPDGQTSSVIQSRTWTTTGSIGTGSKTLTVTDGSRIEVGTVVAIQGARGQSDRQVTTLVDAINSTQTTGIRLADLTGFFNGSTYLVVGTEVITYTGISSGALTGVTRGAFGTTVASHAAGAWIGQGYRLYGKVVAVYGNTVSIDRAAALGVSGAQVTIGTVAPRITDLAFDMNKIPTGSTAGQIPRPVKWDQVSGGTVRAVTTTNGESAFYLAQGSRDCTITDVTGVDCGIPGVKGSGFWVFQGCENNTISSVTLTGKMYNGLYIDDRTAGATEWDGPCTGNDLSGISVHADAYDSGVSNVGINITGSPGNVVNGFQVSGVRTGVVVDNISQMYRPDGAGIDGSGNMLQAGIVTNCFQPWSITAPGTTVVGVYFKTQSSGHEGAGANPTVVASSPGSGQAPVMGRFHDGVQAAPGISFTNDTNTGFWRIADDDIAVILGGQILARFRPTTLRMGEGKHLELGTGTGSMIGSGATQKMGFWGATPAARPNGTPPPATDLASAITLVNDLRVKLIQMGLVGI